MEQHQQIEVPNQEREMFKAFALSDFYQLISLSMALPTNDLGNALKDGSYRRDGISILKDLSCERQVINQLENDFYALEKELVSIDSLLSTMGKEYTRLFNHPDSPKIGIYETMYSDTIDGAILFVSPEALDVDRCYQEAGIQLVNKSHEPPDHLCIELEFMMYLYRKKGMALHQKDYEELTKTQQQIKFFEKEHIGNWVPKFFELVETETELRIYQLIAKLARHGLNNIVTFEQSEALS